MFFPVRPRPLLYGLATRLLPSLASARAKAVGGTESAAYCYSVWLRHLALAGESGLTTAPARVAELGPGNSLGMGLAALLTGSEVYHALDVVDHEDLSLNLAVFEALVALFKARAPIPGPEEFPRVKPFLASYEFPAQILTEERMARALAPERLERIRRALVQPDAPDSPIRYIAPWDDASKVEPGSVEMLFSQAVLEHVDDLPATYRAMHAWLAEGGVLSHQIDFKCHGLCRVWNGHWATSDTLWALLRGRRPYLLNRAPRSAHLTLLEENGFHVTLEKPVRQENTLARAELAPRFRELDETDLSCAGTFLQAVKR